ncbi:MAG: molybdopterin-binding protein, partial [Rhodospirillaceae bacterium]
MTETERMAAQWWTARQEPFLDLAGRDEAEARFHRHLHLEPLGAETVPLANAPGRVLAEDAVAGLDVPGFDRSTVDGVALRSMDTGSARDTAPVRLRLTPDRLGPGIVPAHAVAAGLATPIAAGGMVPRGADAVVSIAQTETVETDAGLAIKIRRAVAPGQAIAAAGSDIARGETVLRAGQLLSSREIGMLAALGLTEVAVWRRPRVAILSTGDGVVAPGRPLGPGRVYDSNGATLAAAVAEYGGEPLSLGIAAADEDAIAGLLGRALVEADMVLLAGGASEGVGDVAVRVAGRLTDPGIVVHGVALKPGK